LAKQNPFGLSRPFCLADNQINPVRSSPPFARAVAMRELLRRRPLAATGRRFMNQQ
jgi:hypothetical protein